VDKLNELIPKEKEKETERRISEKRFQRDAEEEEEIERTPFVSRVSQLPPTEGVLEAEREAEEHIEEEEREHAH